MFMESAIDRRVLLKGLPKGGVVIFLFINTQAPKRFIDH